MSLAIPEPSDAVLLDTSGIRSQAIAFFDAQERVESVREGLARLDAIRAYLASKNAAGIGDIEAAARYGELRIGELIGAGPGQGNRTFPHAEKSGLHPQREAEFRKMAADPEAVEDVIAESTDEEPASRRKVLGRIDERRRSAEPPEGESQRQARADRDRAIRTAGSLRMALAELPVLVERAIKYWDSPQFAPSESWDQLIAAAAEALDQLAAASTESHTAPQAAASGAHLRRVK